MVPQVRARTALTFLCLSDRANLGLCCALLPKGLVSPVMSRNLVRQRQSEQRILLRPKFVHPRFVPLHVRYSRRNVGANLGHQRVWVAQEKPGPPALWTRRRWAENQASSLPPFPPKAGGKGWGTHGLDRLMENGNESVGQPPVINNHVPLITVPSNRSLRCLERANAASSGYANAIGPLFEVTTSKPRVNAALM